MTSSGNAQLDVESRITLLVIPPLFVQFAHELDSR
jgi:hypothetical protein